MNARSAQVLAAVLGFLLIVLVGASIFVLLNRTPSRPTLSALLPSPSASAPISPLLTGGLSSPTGLLPPTETPQSGATPTEQTATPPPTSTGPTPSPTETPTPPPTEPPTPTPSPTPSPTPRPTVNPTAPQRELRLTGVGLDYRNAEGAVERYVTFNVDGQSLISARLSNVSAGHVRICLWQGDNIIDKRCSTVHNGKLTQDVFAADQTTWTVSLIGTDEGVLPVADLTVDFNADSGQATLSSFPFRGTLSPGYNGFVARVDALADGDLGIDASLSASVAAHLLIEGLGSDGGALADQSYDQTSAVQAATAVSGGVGYRFTLENPSDATEVPVFVEATLTWP
jgi:hypothetical protein